MKNSFDPDDEKAAERTISFLLKYRMRSEKEIIRKLERKGFSPKVITNLVFKLKNLNLIDDKLFANMYIYDAFTLKHFGSKRIINELKKLGVENYIIYDELEKIKQDVDIYNIALEEAKKSFEKTKKLEKTYSYLLRKGFENSIISYVLSDLKNN